MTSKISNNASTIVSQINVGNEEIKNSYAVKNYSHKSVPESAKRVSERDTFVETKAGGSGSIEYDRAMSLGEGLILKLNNMLEKASTVVVSVIDEAGEKGYLKKEVSKEGSLEMSTYLPSVGEILNIKVVESKGSENLLARYEMTENGLEPILPS